MQNIKLYDIHGPSAIQNYKTLITDDDKYFYWDSNKFNHNSIGDIVFWVNRTERDVLYTKVDLVDIIPTYKNGKTFINNSGYRASAISSDKNKFEKFYRFRIIQKAKMPEGWNYSNINTFNSQNMAIILYEPKVKDVEKKIEKINDIKQVFSKNDELVDLLDQAITLLKQNGKGPKNNIMEKFRNYLYQIHKNKTTSDDYIKMMPKIQKWLIDTKVVDNKFNIWENTTLINSINKKLSTTFKDKWKELNKKEKNWYSSPWNSWTKFNNERPKNDKDDAYSEILGAIKTKPFILLAGISGTGKSRLVRTLAYKTCSKEQLKIDSNKPGNFELIPVRPNWHDSSELIGYISRINGEKYIITPFLQFIAKAWKNLDVPFFLCLDEMNLAPVEQYFAEYLSIIETRQNSQNGKIVTDYLLSKSSFENEKLYLNLLINLGLNNNNLFEEGIGIPNNLVVIGTVNMDETTHSFSRKVLDRAMTFEMNKVDLNNGLDISKNDWKYPASHIPSNEVIGEFTSGAEVINKFNDSKKVIDYLVNINNVLEGSPFKIAYRVRDEFLIYCYYASLSLSPNWLNNALDDMTSMKILSRIEGDEMKLASRKDQQNTILDDLKVVLNDGFKKSKSKLNEMSEKLKKSGYTSFWS